MFQRLLVAMGVLSLFATLCQADVPKFINYQGRLTNLSGNSLSDGTYSVTFRFYLTDTATTDQWSGVYAVETKNGYFNVLLGSGSYPFSGALDFNQPYFLGIKVEGDSEMTPRQPLNAVPYAFNIVNGCVTTDKIADKAVTNRWQAESSTRIYHSLATFNPTLLTMSINLSKSADVFIYAKATAEVYGTLTATQIGPQIIIDGSQADYNVSSIHTNSPDTIISASTITNLAAGSHEIKFELLNAFTPVPSDASYFTSRHRIFAVVFYK